MSAKVRTYTRGGSISTVYVPRADRTSIDKEGNLHLVEGYGSSIGIFRSGTWDNVVVSPERDSNGRFIKKGNL